MDLSFVRFDIPELTNVSVYSDNSVSTAFAKTGDTATLTFTADDTIDNVLVTMVGQSITATDTGNNIWTATYTLDGTETDGTMPFSIDYTRPGASSRNAAITATTDASDITIDVTAPVITLNGNATVTLSPGASFTDPGTTLTEDNIDANGVVVGGDTVDTTTGGTYVITYNATDKAGNTATQVTRSVVVDALPVAIAQDITVNLDSNGQATITPAMVDNGSSDVEGAVTFGLNKTTFSCSDASGSSMEGAIHIDGTASGWLDLGNVDNFTTAYTVESWINTTNTNTQNLFSKFSGGVYGHFLIWQMADGRVKASNSVAPYDLSVQPESTTAINDGKWHHIAVSYGNDAASGGSNIKIYIDGVLEATSANQSINADGSRVPFLVGVEGTGTNKFGGQMDDILIWNTCRTQAEILEDLKGNVTGSPLRNYDGSIATANQLTDQSSNAGHVDISSLASTSVQASGVPVVLTATDGTGNSAFAKAYITVEDNTAPGITLTGDATMSLSVGGTYSEPGATATDNCGVATGGVVIAGHTVDTATAGDYTITYNITDVNGNAATQVTRTVSVVDPPVLSIVSTSNVLCHGDSTGSITATITGGVAPFSFTLSNGTTTTSVADLNSPISGLPAGIYTLSVTDGNGSTDQVISINISQPSPLNAQADINHYVRWPGSLDGLASVQGFGGMPPYTYSWSGGVFGSNFSNASEIFNVGEGTYSVVVTDANGCTATSSVDMIADPNPDLHSVTISSNNANSSFAKVGDVITLEYTWTYHLIRTTPGADNPTVSINGNDIHETAVPGIPNRYRATYTVTGNENFTDPDQLFVWYVWYQHWFPAGLVEYGRFDSSGNDGTTVTGDFIAPVLSFGSGNGNANISLNMGDAYSELGATLTDVNPDSNGVVIGGDTVDTSTAGTYVVTYDATDMAGNTATQLTRTVTVVGHQSLLP